MSGGINAGNNLEDFYCENRLQSRQHEKVQATHWDEKDSWHTGTRRIAGTLGREGQLAHLGREGSLAHWDKKDHWHTGTRRTAGTLGREAKLAHWNEQITRPLGHLVHWEEKERRH